MESSPFFKSVIDQDPQEVVICDIKHIIRYMNPAACRRYAAYGGETLIGKSLLHCHPDSARERILQVLDWFQQDPSHNIVHTYYSDKQNEDVYMVALRDENRELIGYYEKHESRHRDAAPLYEMEE